MTTPSIPRASIGSLKRIPASVFRMGSRFHAREFPSRMVESPEFQIAQAPVTVSQFAAFRQRSSIGDLSGA